jgi:hypothetical protein
MVNRAAHRSPQPHLFHAIAGCRWHSRGRELNGWLPPMPGWKRCNFKKNIISELRMPDPLAQLIAGIVLRHRSTEALMVNRAAHRPS